MRSMYIGVHKMFTFGLKFVQGHPYDCYFTIIPKHVNNSNIPYMEINIEASYHSVTAIYSFCFTYKTPVKLFQSHSNITNERNHTVCLCTVCIINTSKFMAWNVNTKYAIFNWQGISNENTVINDKLTINSSYFTAFGVVQIQQIQYQQNSRRKTRSGNC